MFVRYWIAGWLMLCLAGPKICDSQSSYWVPSYYNHYPIESSKPIPLPLKTYYRYSRPVNSDNYLIRRDHLNFPAYPPSYEYDVPSQDIQEQQRNPEEENTWEEQEILEKLDALERILSDDSNEGDPEIKNSINYKIISDSLMSEETKRVVRQARKDKPGFFWTLARLAFECLKRCRTLIVTYLYIWSSFFRHYDIPPETFTNTDHFFQTFNDTKSAVKQISTIVGNSIVPDSATQRPTTSDSLMDASKPSSMSVQQENATTQSTTNAATTMTTTTPAPRLTTSQLQSLIRRNVKGLVRLFNIEWQEALQQSDLNVEEFRKDLGKQVGRYLQDNPNAY